jgi:hypothetical protein
LLAASAHSGVLIGEIKEGVKEEYDLCQELGVDCVVIP